MFTGKIKPDYRVPGLSYKRQPGLLTGKLYTALPRRFKTAARNAAIAAFLSFFGLWAVLSFFRDPISGFDAFLSAIAIFILSYPIFVAYDPGERIRMSQDTLSVGPYDYDLTHVSPFYKIEDKDSDGFMIGFRNGEREEKISIINSKEVVEAIIPFLNRAKDAILSEPQSVSEKSADSSTGPASRPARIIEF